MSTASLHRRRLVLRPPRWPFVVAAAVAVLLAATFVLVRGHHPGTPPAPSGQQIAAAQALIDRVPVPAGATRDRYATACGMPAEFCATSGNATPEALFTPVVTQLKQLGAKQEVRECALPTVDIGDIRSSILGTCFARLRYHGVPIAVLADDKSPLGAATPTWVSAAVLTEPGSGPPAPLARWQTLAVLPAGVHPVVTCKTPASGGCTTLRLEFTVALPLQQTIALLQTTFAAGGYRPEVKLSCGPANARSNASCSASAKKFLTQGGHDGVLAIGWATTVDAHHTSVRVYVTALP